MRFGFAGTPDFAVPSLRALVQACAEAGDRVVAVWTQPDRPAGRGRRLTASPVKQAAAGHAIEVLQPPTLRVVEAQAQLTARNLDVLVVVAYGLLLPKAILDAPRLGCINVHASLLPRWRGAAPIQRSIAAGDTMTGVGIMQMDEGLDTGPLWRSQPLAIAADDTGGSLHDKLAVLGARELVAALPAVCAGGAPRPQDDTMTTYAHKLNKAEALIDWGCSAAAIINQVRAFNPWPVAHTTLHGRPLRVLAARAQTAQHDADPGTVLSEDGGIAVACGVDVLVMERVQAAGGKAMSAAAFVNAHPCLGARLGAPS